MKTFYYVKLVPVAGHQSRYVGTDGTAIDDNTDPSQLMLLDSAQAARAFMEQAKDRYAPSRLALVQMALAEDATFPSRAH